MNSKLSSMKLIITIDTEEDNWGEFNLSSYTVDNIRKIPEVQALFDQFNIKPTYLITYSVATDPWAIELFSGYLAEGKCDIGMHCHPWNTPPFEETVSEYNSMLCNLQEDLQYRKLELLKNTICENYNYTPVSFRAGRWGFGNTTARVIHKLGMKVDSSVTAYTDWSEWHGVDFSDIGPRSYRFSPEDIFHECKHGELIQIPATVGFLQKNYSLCNMMSKVLDCSLMQACRVRRLLMQLKVLNKVALSPETSTSQDMIALAKTMQSLGFDFLNMFFHSNSLMAGLSPFVRTLDEEKAFIQTIERFLTFGHANGWESNTLADFEKEIIEKDIK